MENFISGFPGCEFQIREALEDVLGQPKADFFFDKVRPDISKLLHKFTCLSL
jgi:hypothetical protein